MNAVRRCLAPSVAAALVIAAALPVLAQDVAPPEVVLLDPGSEPRVLLRYDPTEGLTQPFELSMDQDVRMASAGRTSPWFDSPTITFRGVTTLVRINDDGTYELEQAIDDMGIGDDGDPALVESLRAQVATLIGMVTRARLDRRGLKLEQVTTMPGGYAAPPGVQPGTFDAQGTPVAQPLPEEPVGEGAVWEVRETSAAGGFEMTTTSTFALEELSPGGFTASVDLRIDAPPQAWDLPDLPPGVEATLERMEMTGSGDMVVDFARFVVGWATEATGSTRYTVAAADESVTTEIDTRISTEMRPQER